MTTNSIDFSEYQELVGEGGFDVKTQVKPEDEFYHAVYISGQQRVNELGETEYPGKLQIRGIKTNLDEINMIITTIKSVLVKTERVNNRDNLACFSYQTGNPPWKSSKGKICGKNSTERAADPFCEKCRSQIIAEGIYIDETGKPFLIKGKPAHIFIRAKGVKYAGLADYLSGLAKRDDLEPIVTPVTEASKKFEKAQVNHKRFITKIKIGKYSSSYGLKDVFSFETGQKLSVDAVKSALNNSKENMDKFKEKFDWTKNNSGQGQSDYSANQNVDNSNKFDFGSQETKEVKTENSKQNIIIESQSSFSNFSFDDIKF